ncbi:MAG: helix-hairpin-helix domain-containing protein [Deltaproteobacteria bacterium]|nr:helix-hairpin-helix domain-containing protein [Deltaproteobacteria bacterium]
MGRVTGRAGAVAALWLAAGLVLAAPMDVNTAPAGDLATLDGVTEELANNIVRDREENGAFTAADDLRRVPGMTADILNRIKGRLAFGAGGPAGNGGKNKQDAEVQRILKKFAREPTVQETQNAALSHARADPSIIDSWRIRSRVRGLAPEFRVGAVYTPQRDYLWFRQAGTVDYLPPLSDERGTTQRDSWQNQGQVAAQMTWQLDRLIFDPEEPRVNREAWRLSKLMDSVLDDVTRRYFERRRLQVELELSPPTDVQDRIRKEIRLQELTADLDGMTGGFFSAELKRRGQAR